MKGKVYRKPVTYSVCRKILAAESIDCLFFLAGGHREDFFSQKEKTPLLSQLEPVLRAANGHKLRRVCLLSSVDLEEEGLLSPALEELRAGERVLLSHCRERRLPVLLLRTGCVFGEAPPDQGGFLGQVLAQLEGSGKALCPFREEASFDFVCGSDLADAVCRELYVNTELDPDYPAMAMPICDGETSIGMAVLYQLDPQQYTVYYKNLFQTLTRMIQDNLIRAVRYQQQNWEKLTLPGTLVLTKEAFAQELSALRLSKEELHCPVSVARVGLPPRTPEGTRGSLQGWGMLSREPQGGGDQSTAALYNRAASLLRGTDLLGIGENGDLQAAFLYVGPSRRPVLEERFSRSGFTLTWLD